MVTERRVYNNDQEIKSHAINLSSSESTEIFTRLNKVSFNRKRTGNGNSHPLHLTIHCLWEGVARGIVKDVFIALIATHFTFPSPRLHHCIAWHTACLPSLSFRNSCWFVSSVAAARKVL